MLQDDNSLLTDALNAFERQTNIKYQVKKHPHLLNYEVDAQVELIFENTQKEFSVLIKHIVSTQTLNLLTRDIRHLKSKQELGYDHLDNLLVVATYINPRIADELRDRRISFLDTAGNCFLYDPARYIFITGKKLEKGASNRAPSITRAFSQTGMKVVFALLCKPELLDAPYREIAHNANVALGTVGWVFSDLRARGFLVELKRGKRNLLNKKELIDKWAGTYPEKLRKKLLLGRYRTNSADWWRKENKWEAYGYWSGEVAAEEMTHNLRPHIYTFYAKRADIGIFIASNRLEKDPKGNVEILNVFWNIESPILNSNLAHPLLVYTDLIVTRDPRCIEIAGEIYDQWINRLISP